MACNAVVSMLVLGRLFSRYVDFRPLVYRDRVPIV